MNYADALEAQEKRIAELEAERDEATKRGYRQGKAIADSTSLEIAMAYASGREAGLEEALRVAPLVIDKICDPYHQFALTVAAAIRQLKERT